VPEIRLRRRLLDMLQERFTQTKSLPMGQVLANISRALAQGLKPNPRPTDVVETGTLPMRRFRNGQLLRTAFSL
jgi:hypothetical protein